MDAPVLEAARQIRPFLTELVGSDAAGPLDDQIADLLGTAQADQDAVARLRALLRSDEATREFLDEVLDDAPEYRPQRWQPRPTRRGIFEALPGNPLPMHAGKYACPAGNDYTWYRPAVGYVIPACPTHHVALIKIG